MASQEPLLPTTDSRSTWGMTSPVMAGCEFVRTWWRITTCPEFLAATPGRRLRPMLMTAILLIDITIMLETGHFAPGVLAMDIFGLLLVLVDCNLPGLSLYADAFICFWQGKFCADNGDAFQPAFDRNSVYLFAVTLLLVLDVHSCFISALVLFLYVGRSWPFPNTSGAAFDLLFIFLVVYREGNFASNYASRQQAEESKAAAELREKDAALSARKMKEDQEATKLKFQQHQAALREQEAFLSRTFQALKTPLMLARSELLHSEISVSSTVRFCIEDLWEKLSGAETRAQIILNQAQKIVGSTHSADVDIPVVPPDAGAAPQQQQEPDAIAQPATRQNSDSSKSASSESLLPDLKAISLSVNAFSQQMTIHKVAFEFDTRLRAPGLQDYLPDDQWLEVREWLESHVNYLVNSDMAGLPQQVRYPGQLEAFLPGTPETDRLKVNCFIAKGIEEEGITESGSHDIESQEDNDDEAQLTLHLELSDFARVTYSRLKTLKFPNKILKTTLPSIWETEAAERVN